MKGTMNVPFFFLNMQTEISSIEEKIAVLLKGHPTHFLVDVKIKPTNNVRVYIDADEGIPLSELISYNRTLYKMIEESGMYPDGNFSLEVSSPGLDEPLKKHRQYKKNIGRPVEIVMQDGTKKEGKLLEVTEETITIETETGKGKKKELKQESIPLNDIKTTKIQIKF
jgi:ribosome maturation factor RimP